MMLAIALSSELGAKSGQNTVTISAGNRVIHCSTKIEVS